MQHSLSHHRGATGIEFIATAIPVLLLGLGGIEISHWFTTRHVLNHALMQASRQASLDHASPESIEQTFEQALNPLFAQSNASQQRQTYLSKTEQHLQAPAWRIHVLSPTQEHFADFHRDDLDIARRTGLLAIDNNYQKEQHLRLGQGLLSGENIFEANTLTLSLSFPYKPIVPGMQFLFRQTSIFFSDDYDKNATQHGYLPIKSKLSIAMQSHPVQWRTPNHGKIIYTTSMPTSSTQVSTSSTPVAHLCYGVWCSSSNKTAGSTPPILPTERTSGSTSHSSTHSIPGNTRHEEPKIPQSTDTTISQNSHIPSSTEESTLSQEKHPLCGISLCCLD